MGMRKTVMAMVITLAWPLLPVRAQRQDEAFQRWLEADTAAFQEYDAAVTRQVEQYLEDERRAFAAFVEAAGAVWGKGNVWVPSETLWVQYSEALDERSAADLDAGQVRVSVIVPDGADEAEQEALLREAVRRVVLSGTQCPVAMMQRRTPADASDHAAAGQVYVVQRGDSLWALARRFNVSRAALAQANGIDPDGWLSIGQKLVIPGPVATPDRPVAAPPQRIPAAPEAAERPPRPPVEVSSRPVLQDQVQTQSGQVVTAGNASAFAAEVVASQPVSVTAVTGADGQSRRTAEVTFPLVPDHIRVRALRYRDLALEFAHQYNVYPPLIFAIMQTESSFNPRARSGAPAYGLMQLVPRSGARDAYRLVFETDALVTGEYLYDPRNNIQLGVAYLHILQTRYFRRVEHSTNRMLCAIAAYNTGAGNVCRAFGAGTSLSRAADIVNGLEPGEVYRRLRTDLPYAETRDYIHKVTDRMPQYRGWE